MVTPQTASEIKWPDSDFKPEFSGQKQRNMSQDILKTQ
jgi:hypothetical protein